jgi:hypothetical protein
MGQTYSCARRSTGVHEGSPQDGPPVLGFTSRFLAVYHSKCCSAGGNWWTDSGSLVLWEIPPVAWDLPSNRPVSPNPDALYGPRINSHLDPRMQFSAWQHCAWYIPLWTLHVGQLITHTPKCRTAPISSVPEHTQTLMSLTNMGYGTSTDSSYTSQWELCSLDHTRGVSHRSSGHHCSHWLIQRTKRRVQRTLQQRLQWMTSPHRPPLTHRDSSQDHFLHIAEPYQIHNYMCGSVALCCHKLLLEHADTLADHPELTPQRMRLVCNENCK